MIEKKYHKYAVFYSNEKEDQKIILSIIQRIKKGNRKQLSHWVGGSPNPCSKLQDP